MIIINSLRKHHIIVVKCRVLFLFKGKSEQ